MNFEDKTLGYCPLCMQNVEHARVFSFTITRFLDFLSFGFFRALRIGPYYCFQCEAKRYYLQPIRRDAPTFDSEAMTAKFIQRGGRPNDGSESPKLDVEDGTTEAPELLMPERMGNLHKNEHSLVMQERRTQNFSNNFRDSIATRILQGELSMTAAKNELKLTDSDLIRWIADLHYRKLAELDSLRQALANCQQDLPASIVAIINQQAAFESGELEGAVIFRKPPT